MSYSIFIASPTALIAQPGRAVNTFPSGLVRVDQTYIGLTTQASTHRAILAVGNSMPDDDSSPCIDGLKIFPEVQERRRGDGFNEYIVSAYGRVNQTGGAVNVFFNQQLSFGVLFYGGQQVSRTYISTSGPSEILNPPIFAPFLSIQYSADVLGNVELFEGDQVRLSRSGPSTSVAIGPTWTIGSGGGYVVRRRTTNAATGGEDEFHYLVTFDKSIKYASHDQRHFGFFSEFVTTYKLGGDTFAAEPISFYRLKVNGTEVS